MTKSVVGAWGGTGWGRLVSSGISVRVLKEVNFRTPVGFSHTGNSELVLNRVRT